MKKILFAVLMFVGLCFGQSEIFMSEAGELAYVSDSLYTTYIDTSQTPDDTSTAVVSKFWSPQGRYDFMSISISDTGTTYDDSIAIRYKMPYSSTWHPVEFLRDSTWTNVTGPAVDDNSIHSYTAYIGNYHSVGIFMTNVQAVLNRVHYFKIQASKKK